LHLYGAHALVVGVGQVPAATQLAGSVATLVLALHVGAVQVVPVATATHDAPEPLQACSQMPLPGQAARVVVASVIG